MATSPRYSPTFPLLEFRRSGTGLRRATLGNESTSVGPFFLRNASFIRAISASLTRQIVTPASCNPSWPCTRRRNDSSGRRATRTLLWRFRIILAGFLYFGLSRILSFAFPLCRCRCFRRVADELHHTLHRRE